MKLILCVAIAAAFVGEGAVRAVVTEAGADKAGRSCNGLVFAGNVVVNPLYCGVRLANVSDVRVENNTFISTNATKRLADDSAAVCLWGGAALKPGEKGVVLRGNKIVLSEKSPLRRLWTTKARQKEVSVADATPDRPPAESRRGLTSP